ERMFGYEARYAIGKPLTLIMPERFHSAHRTGFERFKCRGYTPLVGRSVELIGKRADGTEFPIELSLGSFDTEYGPVATGVVRDISERKALEERLQHFSEQLAAANRELEAFSYSVSHDL